MRPKVGIIEDDPIVGPSIVMIVRDLGYEPTKPCATYETAIDMLENQQPDIALIDIDLKSEKDGIDVATRIKTDFNIPFIFLTGNSDHEMIDRAKRVDAPAYLTKPFKKEDLYAAIEIGLSRFQNANATAAEPDNAPFILDGSIFVKQGQHYDKINVRDIVYMMSDNVYVTIFTKNSKMLVRSTLSKYLELLNDKKFFRIHRRYVVNVDYLESINGEVVVVAGSEFPITKPNRDALLSALRIG